MMITDMCEIARNWAFCGGERRPARKLFCSFSHGFG